MPRVSRLSIPGMLALAACLSASGGFAASLAVSGGLTLNGTGVPLLFTWNTPIMVTGSGWKPGEAVEILLYGPLDSPEVSPRQLRRFAELAADLAKGGSGRRRSLAATGIADLDLGSLTADANGNLSGAPMVPYDSGITGPGVRIPRPGLYEVRAAGASSGTAAAADRIALCPATYTGGGNPIDWGHERGGRDGVLPGVLRQYSPERFDPEWPTTWDERPVEAYGTVAPSTAGPAAQISLSDNPATHYAHDAIFFLVPDPAYKWLIGTANYYSGETTQPEIGRLEVEWETRNGGSTAAYGQGNIGLPLWATPSVGDRVYVLGRWILDAGHPELGDRTEIHPPRLVATMRERPGVAASGAAAAQVDIYASGHGGGANQMPPGLTTILDLGGRGGGRIRDVLSADDQDRYYRPGPLAPLLVPLLSVIVQQFTGSSISGTILPSAGPSAFPWGGPGPEQRPINNMDYDFDVPLPPAPAGAASVALEVVTRPENSTAVAEQVTYANFANGLPTTAHIHLPYRAADDGIYARTLKFSWNTAAAPGRSTVRLDRINVKDSAGKWQMWADVSGNWVYLSGAAPALLNNSAGQSVTLPDNPIDVSTGPGDTVRIYVQGYRAACLDDYFGKLFGMSSYAAGLTFVGQCGPTDNQDLGGAVLELPAQPPPEGTFTVNAADSTGKSNFSVDLEVH